MPPVQLPAGCLTRTNKRPISQPDMERSPRKHWFKQGFDDNKVINHCACSPVLQATGVLKLESAQLI